jgi:hypothetical protein
VNLAWYPLPITLQTLRSHACAGILANAGVVLISGKDASGTNLNTAEQLTAGGSVQELLTYATSSGACVAVGPKLLVAGGLPNGTATWVNSSVGGIQTIAGPNIGMSASALVAATDPNDPIGYVYVIGGFGVGGALASGQRTDKAFSSFTAISPMATKRSFAAGTALPDGTIWVAGGNDDPATGDGVNHALGSSERYSPITTSWSMTASLKTARWAHGAVLAPDGRVYVIGGRANDGSVLLSVEVYDPARDQVSLGTSLTLGRAYAATTLDPDGRILAIGGCTVQLTCVTTGSIEAYGPVIDPASVMVAASNVTFNGTHFAPNASLRVQIAGSDRPVSGTTDASGAVSGASFSTAGLSPGPVVTQVRDTLSAYPTRVSFTVP